METMAPLFARVRVSLWCFVFFFSFPARTAHILDGQGSESDELYPEFECLFTCHVIRPTLGFMGRSWDYRTCMASSAENKSFCELSKYVINTRPHCPQLIKILL